jgi:hypothetical protein
MAAIRRLETKLVKGSCRVAAPVAGLIVGDAVAVAAASVASAVAAASVLNNDR